MTNSAAESWFENVTDDQQQILRSLRKLILTTEPEAIEEIKWSRPCYSGPNGLFCYLHTTKHHATLGFQQGSSLEDPYQLLEGTGKDMRHIKIKPTDDLKTQEFADLIRAAFRCKA